jgi:hypothetical protein
VAGGGVVGVNELAHQLDAKALSAGQVADAAKEINQRKEKT